MKSTRDSREARITIPDLMMWLAAFAFLAALYPVYHEALVQHAGEISPGTAFLWQLVLPLALLVFFSIIFVKAIGGMPR